MPPVINLEECNGCGVCADVCPLDVIKMRNGLPEVAYPEECWHCASCKLDCPRGAIELRIPLPLMLLRVEVGKEG
jgi:adenylylsulfate reductase subunit B